jgi:hypothetical protein
VYCSRVVTEPPSGPTQDHDHAPGSVAEFPGDHVTLCLYPCADLLKPPPRKKNFVAVEGIVTIQQGLEGQSQQV